VPIYEEAPVLAWDAGAAPDPLAARVPIRERALWVDNDMRLSASSIIQRVAVTQRVAERASDERRNNTNVSDDQQSR
jgi:hypothetical protein